MKFFNRIFFYFSLAIALGLLFAVVVLDHLYVAALKEEEMQRTQGISRMVEQWPQATRHAQLADWQGQFGYQMSFALIAEIPLSDEERQSLMQHGVWVDAQSGWVLNDITVYYKQPDFRQVLVLKKQYYSTWNQYLYGNGFILMVLLVLALFVVFYVRRHERYIKELNGVYSSYGRGQLNIKADNTMPPPYNALASNFNLMAEQIEKLLKEKEIMVNGVSHDLKGPLSRLRFSLDMTRSAETVGSLRTHIEQMDMDLDELSELLDDWMLYAQIKNGEDAFSTANCDIRDMLNGTINKIASLHGNVAIHTDLAAVTLDVNEKLFRRALYNLIDNGLKFAANDVWIRLQGNSHGFELHICDDGPGIPDHQKQRVLEPFVRLDASRTSQGGGLGLAIVKTILDQYGMRLEINDRKVQGTCFIICSNDALHVAKTGS